MVESHCRADCRADHFRISDAPHQRYYENGVPILLNTGYGKVIEKAILEYTLSCPLCSTPNTTVEGHYDADEEPICPNCGLLLTGDGTPRTDDGQPLLTDAKAAGRVDGGN